MGIFGDKPENQASQESISPQMVESLKIRHWEIQYDEKNSLCINVTATVILKGNLTAKGAEVGFFLNHNLLGVASSDDWGKVSFKCALPEAFQIGDTLTTRIKGTTIDEQVVLTHVSVSKYYVYSDGTLLDTQTQLMWMRCALGQTWNGTTCVGQASEMNWSKACQQKISFAGYKDWRIPTIEELRILVDTSQFAAKIHPQLFPNCPADWFWSGSPFDLFSTAWCINFGHDGSVIEIGGADGCDYRKNGKHVRLVRDRQ